MLRLAAENPGWGYQRIAGQIAHLGRKVSPAAVWAILKKAGFDPAPRRSDPTWGRFLKDGGSPPKCGHRLLCGLRGWIRRAREEKRRRRTCGGT
ncbi:hypothetical protein Airi02_102680 [Actinoallomurus iriomotensis]|uniref:Integrase n=1 Tax=Actinoallomurus iriomotensis TaxID=478107 RepID=A0A9W6SCL4_9ACTN|nr:hypothetical protein Airi02_102680 [Actinoallomurus iriomotensis]